MKNILLFNTSFKNKGDALMNAAIISEIGEGNVWVVPASLAFTSPMESRAFRVVLCSDLPGVSFKRKIFNAAVALAGVIAAFLPRKLMSATRFVPVQDLDLAVDVSGYCYGDVWGQRRVDLGCKTYKNLSAAGVKIVLMPKTWGPFERISKESINNMLQYVDLAFCRDKASKALLDSLANASVAKKLLFAPDYTHRIGSYEARAAEGHNSAEGRNVAYLIPSYRVIDSGALPQSAYLRLMSIAREMFVEAGLDAKLLIHETSNDLRFIDMAATMGLSQSDVVIIDDPLDLKETISRSSAVLTSRLHGLYSALNSSVPVAVVAWSFKYREALEQYGCSNCLIDLNRSEDSLREVISYMLNPEGASSLRAEMQAGKAASDELTTGMWWRIRETFDLGAKERE